MSMPWPWERGTTEDLKLKIKNINDESSKKTVNINIMSS